MGQISPQRRRGRGGGAKKRPFTDLFWIYLVLTMR